MVSQRPPSEFAPAVNTEVHYPDSDGQPMADNTLQFQWIQVLYHNLCWRFADRADVFVAGDLFWYPVEGNNQLRQAPDVMVAIGRPPGDRGSYRQWVEEDIAPQVVFEILSPGNRLQEMARKLAFYDRYGVQEYYLYDPCRNDLAGWIRTAHDPTTRDLTDPPNLTDAHDPGLADPPPDPPHPEEPQPATLVPETPSRLMPLSLAAIAGESGWISPLLGIRFVVTDTTLALYHPDGAPFLDYLTVQRQLVRERARAETERERAETERARADRLAAKLRDLGIDPEA